MPLSSVSAGLSVVTPRFFGLTPGWASSSLLVISFRLRLLRLTGLAWAAMVLRRLLLSVLTLVRVGFFGFGFIRAFPARFVRFISARLCSPQGTHLNFASL